MSENLGDPTKREFRIKEIARNQALHLALSTVLLGANSFAIIYVGSRNIEQITFSNFLAYWVAFNTITLTLVGPYDLIFPRSYPKLLAQGLPSRKIANIAYRFGAVTGAFSVLVIFAYFAVNPFQDSKLLVALLFCALVSTLFHSLRIYLTSSGRTSLVVALSAIAAFITLSSLVVQSFNSLVSVNSIINSLSLGFFAGFCIVGYKVRNLDVSDEPHERNDVKSTNTSKDNSVAYLKVLLVTLLQLLLASLPIMLAPFLDVSPQFVIQWVAIAAITRIPLTVLNALTPPILNNVASLAYKGGHSQIVSLLKKNLAVYFVLGLLITIFISLAGNTLSQLLTGSSGGASVAMCFLIATIESIVAVLGLPRAFMVVIGQEQKLISILLRGSAIYGVILTLPIDGEFKLLAAPIATSLFLTYFASRAVFTECNKHVETRIEAI